MEIGPPALTRDRLLAGTLLLGTVLILALCVAITLPFIPALTWAAALAILTRRMHAGIERHIPNRSLAAVISVAIVAVVIIAPMIWIGFRISQEVADGLRYIQISVKESTRPCTGIPPYCMPIAGSMTG